MTEDILERLKNSSKINGAYPRDIADAIKTIEKQPSVLYLWFDPDTYSISRVQPSRPTYIPLYARKEDLQCS